MNTTYQASKLQHAELNKVSKIEIYRNDPVQSGITVLKNEKYIYQKRKRRVGRQDQRVKRRSDNISVFVTSGLVYVFRDGTVHIRF